jgi:hypothetical protein
MRKMTRTRMRHFQKMCPKSARDDIYGWGLFGIPDDKVLATKSPLRHVFALRICSYGDVFRKFFERRVKIGSEEQFERVGVERLFASIFSTEYNSAENRLIKLR